MAHKISRKKNKKNEMEVKGCKQGYRWPGCEESSCNVMSKKIGWRSLNSLYMITGMNSIDTDMKDIAFFALKYRINRKSACNTSGVAEGVLHTNRRDSVMNVCFTKKHTSQPPRSKKSRSWDRGPGVADGSRLHIASAITSKRHLISSYRFTTDS